MDEGKGIALVILGIVAVIAIVGLVLMFSSGRGAGASVTSPAYVTEPFSNEALGKYYVLPGENEANNEAWRRLYYRDVAGEYAEQPGFARTGDFQQLARAQERVMTQPKGMYAQ